MGEGQDISCMLVSRSGGKEKKTRAQNVMWILVKGCAEGQDASESERECGFGFGGGEYGE